MEASDGEGVDEILPPPKVTDYVPFYQSCGSLDDDPNRFTNQNNNSQMIPPYVWIKEKFIYMYLISIIYTII